MASSIVECIAEHARRNPSGLCLADNAGALTYADLWARMRVGAVMLREANVSRGDCVAVECDQSVRFLVALLSVQLLGAVAVPLEKGAAVERQSEIVSETGAVARIGKAPLDAAAGVAHVGLDRFDAIEGEACGWDGAFPAGGDIAEILFSTGTTGKSKGIVISHRNNMAIAENIVRGVEMKPGNVEAVPMPLSHSHGLRTVYANLFNGSAAIVADGVIALKRLLNLMDEYRATSLDLSPSMLSIIFKLSGDRLGEYADVIDYVELGSAPLPEEDKLHLARVLPDARLYNFYGSTEAGRSCVLEFGSSPGKIGCIGKPAVNARFVVVDENRRVIASTPDNPGLLASAGDINMVCYLDEPELTAETMSDGYIYTKDLGYIGEDGYVYMLGRKDDVINFGGVKIAPEEIESIVAKNPIVADCACIPMDDPLTSQAPLLCVVLEDGAHYDEAEFRRFLAQEIDANKQPKRVELLDAIPRTSNGKIKRAELVKRFDG